MRFTFRRTVLCTGLSLLALSSATARRLDDTAPKPRPFLGTIQVPPERRAEILKYLHAKGFTGAYLRDDLAPETLLYKGTMAEHDQASRAVWKLVEDPEKSMMKTTTVKPDSGMVIKPKVKRILKKVDDAEDGQKKEDDFFAKMDLSELQRGLLKEFRKEMEKRSEEFRDGTPPDAAKMQRGEEFNKWMHQNYQAILTQGQYDDLFKHWGGQPRKIPQGKPPFVEPRDKDRSDEAIFNQLGLSARQAEHLRKLVTWMRDASAKLPEADDPRAEGEKLNAQWRAGLQRILTKEQWRKYLTYWEAQNEF